MNPGASILTMRYGHEIDPLQAQMLAYRSTGPAKEFFKQYSVTSEAAMKDTIRRRVDPLMWQYHGEETRRSFGWFTNQANVFASPLHYVLGSGLGFIPFLPQLSPKELITGASSIYKASMETYKASGSHGEAWKTAGKLLGGKVSSGGGGTLRNMAKIRGLKDQVPCSSCGVMTAHGGTCGKCHKFVP